MVYFVRDPMEELSYLDYEYRYWFVAKNRSYYMSFCRDCYFNVINFGATLINTGLL